MAIAKLSIDLEARLANLQAGLDKAGLLAARQAERMTSAFKGVQTALGGIAGYLTAREITQGFVRLVDGLDALNDAADATGASIENLSALEDIAARNGTAFETVTDAVVRMNKALGDAKPGSDTAEVFKALGLSIAELKQLDPAEAFQRIAVSLQRWADDGAKARIVQELFGKSLKEVAPLLKDAAEAGKLSATVTTEQAKAAEAYNKQVFALQKNVVDAARAMTGSLLPAMNDILAAFNNRGFKAALDEFGEKIGFGAAYYGARNVRILKDQVAELERELAGTGFLLGGREEKLAELASKRARLAELERDTARAVARDRALSQIGLADNYSNEGRNALLPSLPDLPAKGQKKARQTGLGPAEIAESLRDALRGLEQTDFAKIERLNAEFDELVGMRASGIGGGPALDERLRKIRDELTELDPAAQKAAESAKRLQQILDSTPSGRLKSALVDIELINEAFAKGKIDAEQWAQAAVGISQGLVDGVEEAGDAAANTAQEIGLVFASAAGKAITEWSSFSDLLKGIAQDILQIAVKATITDPLSKAVTGAASGFDWTRLIGLFVPGFATGTDYVPRDMLAMVHRGERIVPAAENRAGAGTGGVTLVQNISIGAGVGRHEVMAAMQATRASAIAGVADAARRGRGVQ